MQGFAVESLTGVDRLWVKARRNNICFLLNKFLSVVLAASLALYTASLKADVLQYRKDYPEATNHNQYKFIYWLLFIYYSFSALDELIELYAVYFEREKGALGLLLEMNNFLGVGVIIYLTVFNYKDAAIVPDQFSHLKSWINFQVIFMYLMLALSILMVVCFNSMQKKVVRKQAAEREKKGEQKAD